MRFVPDHLVLSVVVGSRAYGLETEESDVDRRGVFAAPTPLFWRLDKPPTHVDGPLPEQFSWEVERFCALALEANPTVLECLWSPVVERAAPAGRDLLALRRAFLSRRARETFTGYADAQFRRLDPERPKWKQAMHMIRLMISGLHLVREGEPLVRMDGHRDRLLALRRGEIPWPEVERWRAELRSALTALGDRSALPEHPDRRAVDDYLTTVRKALL
ncbi:DNA polymerase beta superfamily protein [Planomonospora sp. ID82291]|uniref:nucleotidyltransferase domain-containing protein n=1 Tax=Planomonospora sp. ID82291 TaxID=2738136 RepID=UPI001A1FE2D2|nr:nucleotidyltransferase domain-containing protein [Planomonospora sp. ID82291]MBG0816596.1 nucleotidyltransferase domain-containing protein [Planomonospora sp. ID82291]